jgi:hypothetical protein
MATNKGSQGLWILAAVLAWFGLRALPSGSANAEASQTPPPPATEATAKAAAEAKNECALKSCDAECSAGLDATLAGFTSLYGVTPRPLIALGADPVDSGLAYYFDAMLEGLEAAAGDVHDGEAWVRDRFFLPWKNLAPDGKPRTELFACRKTVPGLILYRRKHGSKNEGLAVFLVGETSTWGIEHPVFADTVRRVSALLPTEPNEPKTISILGPTFSGTANSLSAALTLERDRAKLQGSELAFKLRSGTATASSALRAFAAFNSPGAAKIVDYRSAAPEDDNSRCAMFQRLRELRVPIREAADAQVLQGVALLSEGATAYGAGFRASSKAKAQCPRPEFEYAFPNLADVRTAYGGSGSQPLGLNVPQSRVGVATANDPSSRIHPTLSSWTPIARDIGLATALSDLAVRSVRYVGIATTDMSDLTFLAQRVKRQLPDVRLFTFENDVLFAHPDYATSLNGMLVVHGARIDPQGKVLPASSLTNVQAREMVQGVYLAALDLLENRAIPRVVPEVSVINNGKVWGIAGLVGTSPSPPFAPRVYWLLSVWLGFFSLLNGAAYLVQSFSARAREHWSLLPLRALRPCRRAELAAAHSVRTFALLLVAFIPALLVFEISMSVPGFSWQRLFLLAGVIVNAGALLVALVEMLRAYLMRSLVPPTAWAYLLLALVVSMFTLLGVAPWAATAPPQRSVTLASGVSPVLPVLLGAGLLYLLVLCGLIRIRLLDTQLPDAGPEVPFQRLPLGIGRALGMSAGQDEPNPRSSDLQRLERRLVHCLHDPWSIAQGSVLIASVTFIGGFALLFDSKPMLTLEAWNWHVLLIATFMACLLVQGLTYLQLWLYFAQLRMLLQRLARHPVASALRRIPGSLLRPVEQQLLATRPETLDLADVAQLLGELSLIRPELSQIDEALLPGLPTRTALCNAHASVQNALTKDLERVAMRLVPERRALCDALLTVGHDFSSSLFGIWQRQPSRQTAGVAIDPPSSSDGGALDVYASSLSAPALAFARKAETFIATLVALQILRYVRYFRYFVVALLGSAVLFVLMTALYALQPQRLMLNVELGITTVIVGTALWMYFTLDRDTALSAIAHSNAGEVTLNSNLVTRVLTWGVLPMVSAIAAQYPEFSQWAFAAVEPLAHALR